MKRWMVGMVGVIAGMAGLVRAQEDGRQIDKAKPVTSLAWLVGGVWRADASKMGPGMQHIETRYQWSDNNAFIRFNTHFISDKGMARTYDGNFYWNPEESTLAMWYMDHANSITQGPVKIKGEMTQMTFRAQDFEGKLADMRVIVLRKTNDRYLWQLEEKQSEGWKQIGALEYVRVAGS